MSVREFAVGEVCIHRDFVCRVAAVERRITGQNEPSRAYMGVPDGTELNPILTMTALYGPDGEPVKNAKPRKDASGAVARASEEMAHLEAEVARLQNRISLLKGLAQ